MSAQFGRSRGRPRQECVHFLRQRKRLYLFRRLPQAKTRQLKQLQCDHYNISCVGAHLTDVFHSCDMSCFPYSNTFSAMFFTGRILFQGSCCNVKFWASACLIWQIGGSGKIHASPSEPFPHEKQHMTRCRIFREDSCNIKGWIIFIWDNTLTPFYFAMTQNVFLFSSGER